MRLFFAFAFISLLASSSQAAVKPVPQLKRIIWVWLENTSASLMATQRFVKTIAATYPTAKFTNYILGTQITQANVMTLIAGTDFGIRDNTLTRIASPTILDLLESHNISWKVYAEDFPGACYLGTGTGNYQRYRVPFLSISRVQSDRYECMKILGFAKFFEDTQFASLPQVSIVIPNLKNSGANSNPATADAALSTTLANIVSAPDFNSATTLIISTINQNFQGNPPGFLSISGFGVQKGITSVTSPVGPLQILKTIEIGLDLGHLHAGDESATPLLGFWN